MKLFVEIIMSASLARDNGIKIPAKGKEVTAEAKKKKFNLVGSHLPPYIGGK
jgi:hypothetical protein